MKAIEIIKTYLSKAIMSKYPIEANYLSPLGTRTFVTKADTPRCYSHQEDLYYGLTGYRIVLGTQFYKTVRNVNDDLDIPYDKQHLIYGDTTLLYDGVFYHELGHVLYTPMSLAKEIFDSLAGQNASNFTKLFSTISNIVEDVCVEASVKLDYPRTISSINHLRKLCFGTAPEVELKEDLASAIHVILNNFRTLTTNRLAYPEAVMNKLLHTYMYVCVNTPDPFLRTYRALAFAAVLWDVFNCQEKPHYSNYKLGLNSVFYKSLPSKYKDKEGDQSVDKNTGNGATSNIVDNDYHSANDPSEASGSTDIEDDVDSPAKDVNAEVRVRQSGFSDPKAKVPSEVNEQEVYKSIARKEFDADYADHIYLEVSKFYDSSYLLPEYLDLTSKYHVMINNIVSIIKKRKAWNIAAWETMKTSGKLNPKSFMTKTHKIYKQKVLPAREADLAFSILVDNSGSMSGSKSRICGEALIILSEVCEKLNIPFEVNAFTEGRRSGITLGHKPFNVPFHKVKTNLAMIQQNVHVEDLCTYQGNIDEINLSFVWNNFRQRPEADKVIIVISDGQTCGSVDNLHTLVKNIKKDGITILGLGICSDEVTKIYPEVKVFRSSEELSTLPKFLNDYLVSKIFKKEEN